MINNIKMNIRLFFLGTILVLMFNNSTNNTEQSKDCFIKEEKFENSPIRNFLMTNSNNKELTNKFLQDTSSFALLCIKNSKFFMVYENSEHNLFEESTKYEFRNDSFIANMKYLSNLNTIYSVDCREGFIVFSAKFDQVGYWIKEKGQIKFILYTKKCDLSCIDNKDKKRIKSLIEIDKILERIKK